MAQSEACKRSLEITIPVDAVEAETARAAADVQKQVRLPGFRPGKAPLSIVKKQFEADIRQKVLESLVPKWFHQQAEQDHLQVVGTPDVTDVHFHAGEPIRFKAEFEVMPEVELGEYRGLSVPYQEPVVSDEDLEKRMAEIRESKAEQVNVDPKALEDGDLAVISLNSIEGADEPVHSDEVVIEVGAPETLEAFNTHLRGMSPGDEKEIDVTYPEDYGQEKLAGRTIKFQVRINGVRRKDLPELNDEFAQDLGDYRTVDELRDAVRKGIFTQRQNEARDEARNKLVDALVDRHEFEVPEALVDNQIRNRVEQRLAALAEQGIDPRALKLDWTKVREAQKEQATREVKASLLLGKVADREGLGASQDEVDKQLEMIARQRREPLAVVRQKFEKDGTLNRIASHIVTEKTLNLLFEHAVKTSG